MEAFPLSRHDVNVLEKMKDPESNPLNAVMVNPRLPKDPVITDPSLYERVSKQEREIVSSMQKLDMQLAGLKPATPEPIKEYRECVSSLGQLISENPRYASARNNRVQAMRRLHGDTLLLQTSNPQALIKEGDEQERVQAAQTVLSDLDEAIKLLTPKNPLAPISPQAGKTLSLAHTQRAAIYHMTAKAMSTSQLELGGNSRKETDWAKFEFEEAASRDFALGGRYGNDIAKALAVSTNPTAKLCGQMVREAMKKEYGSGFGA